MAKGGQGKTLDPATAEANAAKLAAWERRTLPLIIAAAVIPLVGISTGNTDYGLVGNLVEIACWVVFVVDLVVHVRLRPRYLRTGMGKFDLFVVIFTSPWYLLPGVQGGNFVALLRLARLARVLVVAFKTPMLKRTGERLGKPFMYVGIMVAVCAAIVLRAEDHKNGFKTYGDSLWWAVVTITTVGYGDLAPESRVGRVTATVLMLTGVALLGTVAASLASLFRLEDKADEEAAEELQDAEAAASDAEKAAAAAGAQVAAVTAPTLGPATASPGGGGTA
ncbi:MAG: two pore domain potassium channel family protein, partial [Actinobacteria bacterium]|nr:two pore domain potassium channel family protein [Actinomycetota bacterium]